MIRSLDIKSGFAIDLPGISGRSFSFGPGLTILWGQNASGKSTIIKLLAAYCGVKDGGWTRYFDPMVLSPVSQVGPLVLPDAYRRIAPGNCEAVVDWDGTPTFFFNAPAASIKGGSFYDGPESSPDGITTIFDQVSDAFGKSSTGQRLIGKLIRILEMTQNPPDLTVEKDLRSWNSTWQENWENQRFFFSSFPADGPMTLLMDEPDSGLSIPNEYDLWTKIIPEVASNRQVIIATHSQMIPKLNLDFDVIELTPGYWEECRDILGGFSGGVEHDIFSQDPEVFDSVLKENQKRARKLEADRQKNQKRDAKEKAKRDAERAKMQADWDARRLKEEQIDD